MSQGWGMAEGYMIGDGMGFIMTGDERSLQMI